MSTCKYYRKAIEKSKIEEWHPTRDKLTHPTEYSIAYCIHESSPRMKDETGELSCNGQDEKCPIK